MSKILIVLTLLVACRNPSEEEGSFRFPMDLYLRDFEVSDVSCVPGEEDDDCFQCIGVASSAFIQGTYVDFQQEEDGTYSGIYDYTLGDRCGVTISWEETIEDSELAAFWLEATCACDTGEFYEATYDY